MSIGTAEWEEWAIQEIWNLSDEAAASAMETRDPVLSGAVGRARSFACAEAVWQFRDNGCWDYWQRYWEVRET